MNRKIRVVAALWFFVMANYLDRVAISFAGPSIMKSLAISPGSFGVVLSSFGLGYMLAQIPGGLLADRWGAKMMLVVGPIFWALFTGATGLVSTVAGLAVARFCFGLSEGISNSSIPKVIGDTFSSLERARAISICFTALAVAPALAGPLVGTLLNAYGWQAVFVVLMAPALLAALINFLVIPAPQAPSEPAPGMPQAGDEGSLGDLLRQPGLWLMALAHFSYNIAYWGYLGWMPSYLVSAHNINLKALGPLGGIPYIFAFLGMLLVGWLDGRWLHRYRPQFVACVFVAGGLSLFFAYRADTLAMSLAGLSGAALCLYGAQGPFAAIMLDLAPVRSRATFAGTVTTAAQIGGFVAPLVIGFLVDATGTFAAGFGFMIVALCVTAASQLAVMPFLRARRERSAI
jgi:ACS family hexuronate transporter-like MFS transporter